MRNDLKIGELAKRAGCVVETVRYYEREGLLPTPPRSEGNYRLYGSEHVERLQFIRHCRSLDMTLDEIRTLLHFRDTPEQDCRTVNHLLDQHIEHVVIRIQQLTVLKEQLMELRSQCTETQPAKDCGILHGLAATEETEAAHLDVHRRGCH